MPSEVQQLEAGIQALETQRAQLGDAVVDMAVAPLRARIATLQGTAEASALAAGEMLLKQVTVLFLDVVGSTKFSQRLTPEEISAVMDGTLKSCTAIVELHRGKVLQYAGDGLLAAFGVTGTQEDDAERAVRCGLALLAEGRKLGIDMLSRHGHEGCNVRVGLHTGSVLLGGGVNERGTIRGIAVNIAARMEQTAPAGTLRISRDTYRHVHGVFDVELQYPIEVKGIDEPIVTYLVQRAKPRAFKVAARGIEGVETRTVGRGAEMERLQGAFKRLVRPGAGQARVLVVGEAGVGKSRLLYDFESWAEARSEVFFIFHGRATPQTQSLPHGLLRDILAWWLQILDSDSMEVAKRKLEDGVSPLFAQDEGSDEGRAQAHHLGQMIGLDFAESRHIAGIRDDGRQIRNLGFHAAAQVFRRIGARTGTPVVLLLDDLHWADDASLDFLEYLAQVAGDVPLLVLALTRATLFEREGSPHGAWLGSALRINLTPLDSGASRELAHELLKTPPEISEALLELLCDEAEGNPFYMEELLKMLADEGVIRADAERWTLVTDKMLSIKVPPTLTGVLQARLDSLPPPERQALQLASVIGIRFWDTALAHIDSAAAMQLPALLQRKLVVPSSEATEDGAREYAFNHHVLRQVTYDTLLMSRRRQAHAKAAQWFANATGARAYDYLATAAEHYERAGDSESACEYFTRAAEHAAGSYAHEVALRYTENALQLASPEDASTRWRLLAHRERTLNWQGRRAEQAADIEALLALAEVLDDDVLRGEAAWQRCSFAMRTGDYLTQENESRRAQALAERAGVEELALRARRVLAMALALQGDPSAGKAIAEQGVTRSRALGLHKLEALFTNVLATCADLQGNLVANLEYTQQCAALHRGIGDMGGQAISTSNLLISYLRFGAHAQAQQILEESLRLNRAVGHRELEGNVLGVMSELALRQGDDILALARAQAAFDIAVEVRSRPNQAAALCQLGNVETALGRWASAASAFKRMESVAREIGLSVLVLDALDGLARVALAQGDLDQAMREVGRLQKQADEDGIRHGHGTDLFDGEFAHRIRLTIVKVLARMHDPRAEDALASTYAALQAAAGTISDLMLRQSFLKNIPEHGEIVALWQGRCANAQEPI